MGDRGGAPVYYTSYLFRQEGLAKAIDRMRSMGGFSLGMGEWQGCSGRLVCRYTLCTAYVCDSSPAFWSWLFVLASEKVHYYSVLTPPPLPGPAYTSSRKRMVPAGDKESEMRAAAGGVSREGFVLWSRHACMRGYVNRTPGLKVCVSNKRPS